MSQTTLPTDVPVPEFLATLDGHRIAEGAQLVELFSSVTSVSAVMWGPSL